MRGAGSRGQGLLGLCGLGWLVCVMEFYCSMEFNGEVYIGLYKRRQWGVQSVNGRKRAIQFGATQQIFSNSEKVVQNVDWR
jgi:hypothetical protein